MSGTSARCSPSRWSLVGRTVGTVEVTQAGYERTFTGEEVAIAEACARMTALAVDNAQLFERQAGDARRLTSLLEAGRALTSSLAIQDVLNTLVRTAASSLGCPEALIFEYDPEGDTLTMRSVHQERPTVYQDLDKPYSLEEYPSDREVLEATDIIVETISDLSLPADVRESMLHHGEKTCLTVPLRYAGRPLGMLTLVETESERVFTDDELEFVRGFGEQAALAIHNAQLFEDMKGMHLGNLRALSSALTAKDFYTIGHTARVAAYAVLLAEELGWTPRAVQQLEEATYLHDIGKIAVADRVLLKSGPLTDEEWGLMQQHPVISAEIDRDAAGRRLRGRRAAPPRALGRRRLPGRHRRRDDPAGGAAAVSGRLLRRDVVAPCLPPRALRRGVSGRAGALCRHAVRPGHGGRVRSRPRAHRPVSGPSCRPPPTRRPPRSPPRTTRLSAARRTWPARSTGGSCASCARRAWSTGRCSPCSLWRRSTSCAA